MTGPRRNFFVSLALSVLPLVFSGCGEDAYPLASVSGTVTLDGQPVANAKIGFEPINQTASLDVGPGSYGSTDQQGRYQLKTIRDENGAMIGPHRVAISTQKTKEWEDGRVETVAKEVIPRRYQAKSLLQFDVPPEGTDTADFKLTTQP